MLLPGWVRGHWLHGMARKLIPLGRALLGVSLLFIVLFDGSQGGV